MAQGTFSEPLNLVVDPNRASPGLRKQDLCTDAPLDNTELQGLSTLLTDHDQSQCNLVDWKVGRCMDYLSLRPGLL